MSLRAIDKCDRTSSTIVTRHNTIITLPRREAQRAPLERALQLAVRHAPVGVGVGVENLRVRA
jgi:hypothetical protein